MNKQYLTVTCLAAVLLSGCASTPINTIEPFQARDLNELLASGQYQQ